MTARIETKPAAALTAGSWTARWATWLVDLRCKPTGWRVAVWRWPQGSRGERIDEATDFASPLEAAQWACQVLGAQGAQAVVDGQVRSLVDFLVFSPAPVLEVQVNE